MEHHVVIAVWAFVWCFWVFFYSILSLQWYMMDLWINDHIIDEDNDNEDTYLIQLWLGEDFHETDEDASYSLNLD